MFLKSCAIALFFVALASVPAHAEASLAQRFVAATPPAALPEFLFEDAAGQSLRLADFKGRPVLLHLWATWCAPCVEELPSLDRLQAALRGKPVAIIALDGERHGGEVAAIFYKRHGLQNLAVYSDPSGRAAPLLHVRGLPATLLIDAEGREIGRIEGGADWGGAEAAALLSDKLFHKR